MITACHPLCAVTAADVRPLHGYGVLLESWMTQFHFLPQTSKNEVSLVRNNVLVLVWLQLAPATGGFLLATKLAGYLYDRQAAAQGQYHHCSGHECFRCISIVQAHFLHWHQ